MLFCTLPVICCALPSVSSLLSPVTFPVTSLILPLACSALPSNAIFVQFVYPLVMCLVIRYDNG